MRLGIDAGLRFEHGRTRWVRPDRPVFDPTNHEVAACPERVARQLIESHHYSHSLPSVLRRYALYNGPFVVAVVAITYPMNDATLTNWYPDLEPGDESADIGRVVGLPGAAFNAMSWMLRRVFELERRRGTLGLVAFADPVRRTTLDGRIVMPGHTGITYTALGSVYAGRSRARTRLLFPDATEMPERDIQKIRAHESGWQGAVERCVAHGLPAPGESREERNHWAQRVKRLLRPLKHGGNHRHLFLLDPIVGLMLPPGEYPKHPDPTQEDLL
jgi:hypothetical protein